MTEEGSPKETRKSAFTFSIRLNGQSWQSLDLLVASLSFYRPLRVALFNNRFR